MDEILKCFLCSSPSAAQERVLIFGNSIQVFELLCKEVDILLKAPDVNVFLAP